MISQHPTHQTNRQNHLPPLSPRLVQCSAYFLSRIDLNNYTIETLQQTIDNVVSGPKSKGKFNVKNDKIHIVFVRIKGKIILAR